MLPCPPRPNNRNGDTLLGNWVEERKVKQYEPKEMHLPGASKAIILKDGNRGILTTKFDEQVKRCSTYNAAHCRPRYPPNRTKGQRTMMIEQTLKQQFRNELHKQQEEMDKLTIEPTDYSSQYDQNHNRPDFVPFFPEPTMPHDVNTEMDITYWSQNADKIHGVSDVQRNNDPFKKNAQFTTPVNERFQDPLHMDAKDTLDLLS